ncbi:protein phosphatase, putative [Plasmodium gallinaceum]|uniref:Protein phosphatase, putative n=1 Tax=Plasmodium gallinaceum TaxID=5849 RepID=A0A1J1GTY8_PLAGA|nr:protein phosphatase, putative [Plasmodium gallinaceum]CRG95919.1 protein phosphatase, putative [Plasmodium gallinaceum]
MEFLSNIYDKVLSGYVFTDVFIYKDWPEKFLGKDINNNDTSKNLNENQENTKENLKEILGTFLKNGKFSDSLWIKDKIFIGDEGICLLGEILTICQIVEFIDSEDIKEVKCNEQFKTKILDKLKRKIAKKRNSDILEEKINSNIAICNSNDNYDEGNNENNDKDENKNSDKNAVSNFVEMLSEGKMNKYGFCEYDQKFNERYHLNNSNDDNFSSPLERCILQLSEDYLHKYVCLLLNTGGKQQVRILRFNKNCVNTNKLLDTLKGTISFLNELRFLFKHFRSQVVLKNRICREFYAYIKFHRGDPNFSGTKAINEFFSSLNDNAIEPLFLGLNEQYLNLLEEAISYCPIATYSFFKNIKLLKKINVNAPRRTWKAVCNLQKVYKNLKKIKEKLSLEETKNVSDEYGCSSIINLSKGEDIIIENNDVKLSLPQGNINSNELKLLYRKELIFKNNMNASNGTTNTNTNTTVTNDNNNNSSNDNVNLSEHYSSIVVGNNKNNNDLFFDNLDNKDYYDKMYNNSLDLYTEEKNSKSYEINKLNDTCLYITSDEESLQIGKNNLNSNIELDETNQTIDENNKTLLDENNKTLLDENNKSSIEDNYKTAEEIDKTLNQNRLVRENSIDELRVNMVKLFKTYGGQCRIGKVQGRCEDATFQTDVPPAFGIFDGVGSWSLEGIDASKFSIGLSLACQREAEKLSKNMNGYAKVSYNTIIRSKLLLKNSLESVKKEYADAYGSSTAIVGILDEYTGKCGISSLGDSVCMILRREFLPGDINFERESYPKFPGESFLYFNGKGRNPSLIRKIIWKTSDQKWENGAPYQLSNLPDRSQWKDLENRGLHSFVKILEKVDIDGDSPDMALSPPSEILCMPGDLILLMSDGVSDNLFDEEIEAYCTFAISPEEACELGDPSVFTPAQDIAYSITNIAKRRSGDKIHCKPFYPFVGKYREPNKVYKGNKVDDISCVAIWVVCETESSVKDFVKNPNEPSTLETDKYYSNNFIQNFNKITDICTPTKTFIKEKNKIDRVNLQQVNVVAQKRIIPEQYSEQNNENTPSCQFAMNFFDSSETPIKFNNISDSKFQDLNDIVLKDEEDVSDNKCDNNNNEEINREEKCDFSKLKEDVDQVKSPKNNNVKTNYNAKDFQGDEFDHTPRQKMSDVHLNEQIEKINKMYIKTPLLFSDQIFKKNKENIKNSDSNNFEIKNKTQQIIPDNHYETPIKQMPIKETHNIVMPNNENPLINVFINNETPIKAFNTKETSLKVDKKITKSKRKSMFSSDKKETPSKMSYTRKRSKKG